MPFLLNLAPLVLVLFVLVYLGTIWRHAPARWALVAGALGGVGGSVLYVSLVLQQRSSTAAIGFLFTPWVFAVAAGSAAAWGFGLHALVHTRQALRGGPRRGVVWAGAVLFLLTSTYYTGRDARSVAGFLRIKWGSVDAPLLEDAYRRAGVTVEQINCFETHDCFTSSEYAAISDLIGALRRRGAPAAPTRP